jgi:hypothetical protein
MPTDDDGHGVPLDGGALRRHLEVVRAESVFATDRKLN